MLYTKFKDALVKRCKMPKGEIYALLLGSDLHTQFNCNYLSLKPVNNNEIMYLRFCLL